MTALVVDDALAEQLQTLATAQHLSIDGLLRQLLDNYAASQLINTQSEKAFAAMAGMFDDDVADLSMTVRETMEAYYREKFGDDDSD